MDEVTRKFECPQPQICFIAPQLLELFRNPHTGPIGGLPNWPLPNFTNPTKRPRP